MKQKTIFFIFLLVGAMALVSCETSEPEVLDTKQFFFFEAKASDWVEVKDDYGLNRYYACSFNLRNLYPDASIDHCAAMAYISYGDYDHQLPYVQHYENLAGALWTRTIDFEYSLQDVIFTVTNSDFIKEIPETMYFRVVFIW